MSAVAQVSACRVAGRVQTAQLMVGCLQVLKFNMHTKPIQSCTLIIIRII